MDLTNTRLMHGHGYLTAAVVACVCAGVFSMFHAIGELPAFGSVPLIGVTVAAAALGFPLLVIAGNRTVRATASFRISWRSLVWLLGLGAVLALPPIAIDLAFGFERDINVPLPGALFFYPAVALVAEVLFHLLPLAVLALLLPRNATPMRLIVPVVFVEPLFQGLFVSGVALQSWLVVGNVSLISALQLWLFQRYGFAAMFGLRIAFYLFWHILWGTARLSLLF